MKLARRISPLVVSGLLILLTLGRVDLLFLIVLASLFIGLAIAKRNDARR